MALLPVQVFSPCSRQPIQPRESPMLRLNIQINHGSHIVSSSCSASKMGFGLRFKSRHLDFSAQSQDCKSQVFSAGSYYLSISPRHHDHGVIVQDICNSALSRNTAAIWVGTNLPGSRTSVKLESYFLFNLSKCKWDQLLEAAPLQSHQRKSYWSTSTTTIQRD